MRKKKHKVSRGILKEIFQENNWYNIVDHWFDWFMDFTGKTRDFKKCFHYYEARCQRKHDVNMTKRFGRDTYITSRLFIPDAISTDNESPS